MFVRSWMTRDLVTVPPTASIADAAVAMARRKIRRVLVTEDDGARLVGLVSSHDVARAFPPDVNPFGADPSRFARGVHDRRVADIMARRLWTTTPGAAIDDVARTLREHRVGAMPVVDGGRPVGIITESDVFRAFVDLIGVPEGLRIVLGLRAGDDAVAFALGAARARGARVATVLTTDRDGPALAALRFLGGGLEPLVDDVWRSGHTVLDVRTPGGASSR